MNDDETTDDAPRRDQQPPPSHDAGPDAESHPAGAGAPHPAAGNDEAMGDQLPDAGDGVARRGTRRLLAVLGALGAVLVLAGLGWLFLGTQPAPEPADPRSNPCIDGLVMSVDDTRLVLRTEDRDLRTFEIRERDLPSFDIPHLRSHSALRQNTRVYYETEGETQFVVAADDAPLTTGPGNEDLRC